MTNDEWISRCAARYVSCGGLDTDQANGFAETCADTQNELYGATSTAWESPEDAADEDMTYWDDDEP